jgi:glycosyltransferase involved in cell wall biosynthesis
MLPSKIIARKILKRADSIHFLSKIQGDGFAGIFPRINWHLFSNFLPTDLILDRLPASEKALFFVGRLIREKGVFELLSAFDELRRHDTWKDVSLWFAGDGPEMQRLRKEVENRPLGSIRLLGYVKGNDLEALYRKAYILILPSYWDEGFPYVVIEAMQAGLPVISTPSGVLPDIIRDSVNGFLVPPREPSSLAAAIQKLLESPDLWETISNNNIRYFQKHLSKTAAEKYYRNLLYSNC